VEGGESRHIQLVQDISRTKGLGQRHHQLNLELQVKGHSFAEALSMCFMAGCSHSVFDNPQLCHKVVALLVLLLLLRFANSDRSKTNVHAHIWTCTLT
jgi:hypothetical protein